MAEDSTQHLVVVLFCPCPPLVNNAFAIIFWVCYFADHILLSVFL
jgi:hypothetical protein